MSLLLNEGNIKNPTDILARINIAVGKTVCEQVTVYGANFDSDTSEDQMVWPAGAAYTLQSAAAALYISSETGADTMDVKVTYLDSAWVKQTVTKALAGQTKTSLGVTGIRVLKLECMSAANPAGPVWVYADDTVTAGKNDTAGKAMGCMSATICSGESKQCLYSIPANHIGLIRSIKGTALGLTLVTARGLDFKVMVKKYGKAACLLDTLSVNALGSGMADKDYPGYIAIPEKSDIYVNAVSNSADNLSVNATLDILVVPSSY